MKRSELVQRLAALQGFPSPHAELEQVATPPEAAAQLLEAAAAREDLVGRSVVDLGSGVGTLAIGAALEGAAPVTAWEIDPVAAAVGGQNARAAGVEIDLRTGDVAGVVHAADVVVMNPPFGAQRRHADRPFWDAAYRIAARRIYAFALSDSRSFIERSAVERSGRVEATEQVPWRFPRTFPHHRKRSVELRVDLWVLTPPPKHR